MSVAEKHGVAAEQTEKITQKMYSAGIISYPRTSEFTIKPEEFEETHTLHGQSVELTWT